MGRVKQISVFEDAIFVAETECAAADEYFYRVYCYFPVVCICIGK